MDQNKQKALDAALGQIERQFGKGSVMRLGDAEVGSDIQSISTGSLGLDIALGIGGLPRGRVVESDVRSAAELSSASDESARNTLPPGLPEASEIVPFSGMRKAIATNMKKSLTDSAQLSFHFEVDVTTAQSHRRKMQVGLTELLVKACSEALLRVPALNSVVTGNSYLRFDQINIAMAVAL